MVTKRFFSLSFFVYFVPFVVIDFGCAKRLLYVFRGQGSIATQISNPPSPV